MQNKIKLQDLLSMYFDVFGVTNVDTGNHTSKNVTTVEKSDEQFDVFLEEVVR